MMINENEEIRKMEYELNQRKRNLQEKQHICNHKWPPEPKYDPETYRDAVFSHFEGHGSDPMPVYNYYTKQKDRWSRECKVCGKVEYTYTKKAVKYEPDFS
jgi:hypothetical protein